MEDIIEALSADIIQTSILFLRKLKRRIEKNANVITIAYLA
jgi:hypothetical protein